MITFDFVALWTGRILLITLGWALIFLIVWSSLEWLYNYSAAFRFAIFCWGSQKRKDEFLTTIHTRDGKVWEFKEVKKGGDAK